MTWVVAILVGALVVGCALVIGEGTASVVNRTDTKREVDKGAPMVEELLLEQAVKDKKR